MVSEKMSLGSKSGRWGWGKEMDQTFLKFFKKYFSTALIS
jgi:hypothetical protein